MSTPKERLKQAKQLLVVEATAVSRLQERINEAFNQAVDWILALQGQAVITGMGKAGIIGQKLSATLASTGTASIFLHPAEAAHGDLGRIRRNDLVIALSNSGETEEILRLLDAVKKIGAKLIVVTGAADSTLAKHADCVLDLGPVDEACPLGLAPTASTTAMLAMGDALAMVVAAERKFSHEEFALYHPAGKLGRSLLKVSEVMRKGDRLPLAPLGTSVLDAIHCMTLTPGRPGAVIIVEQENRLAGFFSDGDLRRLLKEMDPNELIRGPLDRVMTKSPKTILPEKLASEALQICRTFKIDQLIVADQNSLVVGLLDVQDLLDIKL